MNKDIKYLEDSKNEIYLWIEQESSIMVRAITQSGDPVELTAKEARAFALMLNQAAEELESL